LCFTVSSVRALSVKFCYGDYNRISQDRRDKRETFSHGKFFLNQGLKFRHRGPLERPHAVGMITTKWLLKVTIQT